MTTLFTPIKLGNIQIKNRFVHSATFECMAFENGEVSDDLIKRYQNLAKGEIGLIIPGYLYVHPLGKALHNQAGIHSDDMIPGLSKIVKAVHQEDGKIAFQIVHSGRQTIKALIGQNPIGPSSKGRDPINFVKPKKMNEDEIWEVIQAFGKSASRAVEAGADAVQLHAAHGYLINQFLSPFFNQRKDNWGGSDENRFRFLKEIILEIKSKLPENIPILVKLNSNDYTPKEGITPPLAVKYAKWLADAGIDGLEISCGSPVYSYMNMCRGDVPMNELVKSLPWWKKSIGKLMIKSLVGKYDLYEGYNLEAAKLIKSVLGEIPLFVVGGFRNVSYLHDVLEQNYADLISMSRPFIRDPYLVKKIKDGKIESVSCVSCNRCLAAVANKLPVRCYNKGFPK